MLSRDDSTEHAGEASERSGTGPLDYPRRHGLPWHFENVPDEMKAECRWVLVRLALQDDGKITKEPYMAAQPDRKASSAAPSTWASFAEAVEAWGRGNWQGLMFALGDGWAGVDFDRVRDQETKDVAAWAEEEAKRLDSYTEVSVSGTGLHTVVYGTLPTSEGCKNADLEMYDHGRFFAVTGRRMPWSPLVVNASQDVLADLCRRRFPEKVEAAEQQQRASVRYLPLPVDDDDLLRLARAAKNGDKFSALYDGGRHGYASESEATAALVRMLAFWTRNDAARMDRLFRRSALMREKWDEKRAGTTWGMREIERACA